MEPNDLGFLAPRQREWLRGEKNLSDHSNPSQFKQRIRKRISGALDDLRLAAECEEFSTEQWERVPLPDQRGRSIHHTEIVSDEKMESGFRLQQGFAAMYGAAGVGNVVEEQLHEAESSKTPPGPEKFVEWYLDLLNSAGLGEKDIETIVQNWPDEEQIRQKLESQE